MSMDSGIQDYYNGAFAKAHPILHKMGMTVFDASNHNVRLLPFSPFYRNLSISFFCSYL